MMFTHASAHGHRCPHPGHEEPPWTSVCLNSYLILLGEFLQVESLGRTFILGLTFCEATKLLSAGAGPSPPHYTRVPFAHIPASSRDPPCSLLLL